MAECAEPEFLKKKDRKTYSSNLRRSMLVMKKSEFRFHIFTLFLLWGGVPRAKTQIRKWGRESVGTISRRRGVFQEKPQKSLRKQGVYFRRLLESSVIPVAEVSTEHRGYPIRSADGRVCRARGICKVLLHYSRNPL